MKKIIVLFALIVFSIATYAQDYGVNYTVAAPTSKAQFFIPKNSTLKVKSTHIDYSVLKDIPAGTLVSAVIADVTWAYPVGSVSSSTATIATLTSTTATITNATVSTTLTLPGATTITKTSGNSNSATTSGSLVVGNNDTLTTTVLDATTKLIVGTQSATIPNNNTILFNNSVAATDTLKGAVLSVDQDAGTGNLALFQNDKASAGDSSVVVNKLGYVGIGKATATVPLDVSGAAAISGNVTMSSTFTGNALIRDSVSFTTTATRVAKAVTGAAPGQFYFAMPKMPAADGSTSRPVDGDLLAIYPKTDSVVITRQAGTTSGLTVYFFRIK